ncbi:MAG: PIN domain-containing protein [Pseudomonadota bacterium]
MSTIPRVMLDACVLFPRIPRALILGAAEQGRVEPLWSARILEEWRRSALKRGGDAAEVAAAIDRMQARWPDAECPAAPDIEAQLHLPDPGDAHVVAAAAGRAEIILTFNIRDFPRRVLAGQGLEARHPDEFLWLLQSEDPKLFEALVLPLGRDHGADSPRAVRNMLKRALLPRLGKAVEAALSVG